MMLSPSSTLYVRMDFYLPERSLDYHIATVDVFICNGYRKDGDYFIRLDRSRSVLIINPSTEPENQCPSEA